MQAWYAVHTRSRAEASVERALRGQGMNTWFPHTAAWKPRDQHSLDLVKIAYMPRYMFVELNPFNPAFYAVNKVMDGRTARVVFAPGGIPWPVPSKVMDMLMARTDPSGLIYGKMPKPKFAGKRGDWVRLSETSAYFGFLVCISDIDSTGKIIVELETFGRKVPTAIKPEDVSELIAQAL